MAREPREIRGRLRHCNGIQPLNATDHASARSGRREEDSKPESQDTGLVALVCSASAERFSDKEKDEASPVICFDRSSWMPSFPALWTGGFFMPTGLNWSLNQPTFARFFCAKQKEKDQYAEKFQFVSIRGGLHRRGPGVVRSIYVRTSRQQRYLLHAGHGRGVIHHAFLSARVAFDFHRP